LDHLILDGVGMRFGRRTVFAGLCARVESGEILVVTGANGSGKSTLLSLIAGLVRPSRGSIRLHLEGREVSTAERRRAVGLVAPDLTLYPELTALENLEFFGRVRSLAWRTADGEAMMERVGLKGRGHDLVGTFSSGMRVRLKYAVALQGQASLLLLDEPTAMLDSAGAQFVERLLEEQRARGITVIATNDPRESRHGDLLLHLDEAA
jgi:heme exporter protein A